MGLFKGDVMKYITNKHAVAMATAAVLGAVFVGSIHYASKAPRFSGHGEDIVTTEILESGADALEAIAPYKEQSLPPLQENNYASEDMFQSDIVEILPEMEGTASPEEWELPHLTLPPLEEF
tara:strand:- start:936 stop:1301 length:366 start_codon:yes stop_codon:yes gene_type:complete